MVGSGRRARRPLEQLDRAGESPRRKRTQPSESRMCPNAAGVERPPDQVLRLVQAHSLIGVDVADEVQGVACRDEASSARNLGDGRVRPAGPLVAAPSA